MKDGERAELIRSRHSAQRYLVILAPRKAARRPGSTREEGAVASLPGLCRCINRYTIPWPARGESYILGRDLEEALHDA